MAYQSLTQKEGPLNTHCTNFQRQGGNLTVLTACLSALATENISFSTGEDPH